MFRRMLAVSVVLVGLSGESAVPQGLLKLCWQLPAHNMDGLHTVEIQPVWAAARRAGSGGLTWHAIPVQNQPPIGAARFSSASDHLHCVGNGRLPAGSYSHIYIAAGHIQAFTASGRLTALEGHIEPIALPLDVQANAVTTAVIELVVLKQADRSGGGRRVFVKDARRLGPGGWPVGPE